MSRCEWYPRRWVSPLFLSPISPFEPLPCNHCPVSFSFYHLWKRDDHPVSTHPSRLSADILRSSDHFFCGVGSVMTINMSHSLHHGGPGLHSTCGLSLNAVVSCKWVGLFTIATLGIGTLYQLWNLLGDLLVSPRLFLRYFMARALCLNVVSILFYMAMF